MRPTFIATRLLLTWVAVPTRHLLDHGYSNLTVLDLSDTALAESRRKLGPRGASVRWMEADITRARFKRHSLDIWHDRAVFHFLTIEEDRAAYVRPVLHALKPGGHVIIMAIFGANGPTQCSGLPVARYAPDALHAEFGEAFIMLSHEEQLHHTPLGTNQQFIYCMCRKMTA
jgi:SAM-dependent methyltransferase